MGNCSSPPSEPPKSPFPQPSPNSLPLGSLRPISGAFRILLLGPGESGKSTFSKQLKILYGTGLTPDEILTAKQTIFSSIIRQMQILLTITSENRIIILPKNKSTAEKVINYDSDTENPWTTEIGQHIQELWLDPGIQKAFTTKSEYQLIDNIDYFFDSLERINQEDWVPNNEDLLRVRQKTKDPYEFQITFQGSTFIFVDVGGQRAERKKWKPLMEKNYSLLLYVTSLSDFDQQLREESTQNRMDEALQLWDAICTSSSFRYTPLVTFFTKEDQLVGKGKSLAAYWPGYKGGDDIDKAKAFVKNRFLEIDYCPHLIHSAFVNTIDSKGFKVVFEDVIHQLSNT